MCSNYEFPSKSRLSLLDIHEEQLELDMKTHVYPLAPAPIIMRGADEFELDIARFGLIPSWAKELKFGRHTYNARTETVASKASFRHAWKNNQFALVPVDTFYEPKYIDGKSHWYAISREDGDPFTVAAIYDDAIIEGEKVRSFSMLTINANQHPFMKQFHNPNDEKRSIIVIPEESRQDWLHCNHEEASEFFFEMRDEFIAKLRDSRLSEN
ncbi:SOS response-associated peptidase [Acinetobacter sp. GFQ9D192M]|uniref:SOS response-associated peptidase n=1 Tax=unclassified Acinetobacter TaxID=196816 RepID=UPI001409B27B|nr:MULTISPECIES: SOS response-associated peptidase family protein [unclassified Acinetobacter]NHB64818.1 SOS response-associated peptidase [Acinetobacter sp. GFQ9D191M]NHB99463.1 SOS response-associated peptidase [Acinetobacter sp. GFQ9D192M]